MNPDYNAPPLNPLPPVVWLLALPIAAAEIVLSLGARGIVGGPEAMGWRLAALQDYAFLDPVFDWMLENGTYPPEYLLRFVSYPFVHGNFTHALIAIVFLLALGKFVGEAYRPLPFIAIFFGAVIVGAVVYGLAAGRNFPLIGAYPGIYGLIGAYTYLMWLTLGRMGENQFRAFTLIGILMGLTLIYSMLFGSSPWWIAEFTGFVTGLFLAPLVAPGGWRAFLNRLRRR